MQLVLEGRDIDVAKLLIARGWSIRDEHMHAYVYDGNLSSDRSVVLEWQGDPIYALASNDMHDLRYILRPKVGESLADAAYRAIKNSHAEAVVDEAPAPQANERNENTMGESTIMNTTKDIAVDGIKLAGGLAATEAVNDAAVKLITNVLVRMGLPEDLLKSPGAQVVLRLFAPFAVANASSMVPALAKHQTSINKACTMAFAAELRSTIKPLLAGLGSMTDELVAACEVVETYATEGSAEGQAKAEGSTDG